MRAAGLALLVGLVSFASACSPSEVTKICRDNPPFCDDGFVCSGGYCVRDKGSADASAVEVSPGREAGATMDIGAGADWLGASAEDSGARDLTQAADVPLSFDLGSDPLSVLSRDVPLQDAPAEQPDSGASRDENSPSATSDAASAVEAGAISSQSDAIVQQPDSRASRDENSPLTTFDALSPVDYTALPTGDAIPSPAWDSAALLDAAGDRNDAEKADAIDAPCGRRQCNSSIDNDCSGKPDNQDDECIACTVGLTRACTTSSPGACATGQQTCVLSVDNASVSWGPCQTPAAGKRDCRSTADNDCNGLPDAQEVPCTVCLVSERETCSTGKPGVCASGTRTCTYDADYSAVRRSDCVGQSAGAKDCCHTADNDCNGIPDNQEPPCNTCVVNSVQPCNSHPGFDGKGLCRAGSQTCVQAANCSDSHWGACSGDVPRSGIEACGPQAPDANCNGTPGDGLGASCITTATVAGKTIKLFTTQVAGTQPVLACSGNCGPYQAFGSCPNPTSTLGYASTQPAPNYDPVTIAAQSCGGSCGHAGYTDPGSGPFYVVPNVLP